MAVRVHEQALTGVTDQITELASRQEDVKNIISEYLETQSRLARRLLVARNRLEVNALRGAPLLSSEEDYMRRLTQIDTDLRRSDGLENRVVVACDKAEIRDHSFNSFEEGKEKKGEAEGRIGHSVDTFDEPTVRAVYEILDNNAFCLQKLSDEIRLCTRDVEIMEQGVEHDSRARK